MAIIMSKKIIDLTMPINDKTPVWPGVEKQEISPLSTIESSGFNQKKISFHSHFGTHIDAPFHIFPNGKKLDEFSLETFLGKAIVIPLSEFAKYSKKIKKNDIVLFYTGQSKKAFSEDYFENTPFISIKIAKILVKKKVKIVGIDSSSPDTSPWEIHNELLGNNILILENLVNLEKIVGKKVELIILPLKIENADGAPCRVIAKI